MPQDEMDVTCPTPRLSTVRMMMAYAIKKNLDFDIYDINSAFLEASSHGTTYIRLPPGRDKPGKAALLCRNLYGSIFAPRLFSNLLYNWMTVNGFVANAHDPCLFTRWDKDGPVHVIAHVDDVGCIAKTHQVRCPPACVFGGEHPWSKS